MNRRKFIQGLLAGVATVAIAAKIAPKFPDGLELETYTWRDVKLGYTITSEEIEDGLYGEIGERYATALAESMRKSREISAANVLHGAF
jgi:hypothetical protein